MKKLNLPFISMIAAALIIALAGVIILLNIGGFAGGYSEVRLNEIKNTITSSISQCYALEGMYPDDLQYLEDHYGLQLDHDNYSYHYEMFATNIFPNIKVFLREAGN